MLKLVHGGDIYSAKQRIPGSVIDFSANINPLGMPPSVQEAACRSISQCVHYPDPICRELRSSLANVLCLPMEDILLGNGAADLIFRIAVAAKPRRALLPAPTFAEYALALEANQCEVNYCLLSENDGFQIGKSFLQAVKEEKPDIVFLCNPNNPTGQVVSKDFLEELLKVLEQQGSSGESTLPVLVLDECFNDFLEDGEAVTMVPQLEKYPNLIILKAFTKMYAMPGLRLGYSLCANLSFNEKIEKCGQAWSVSIPAQAAGIQALKEIEFPQRTRDYVASQRQFLRSCLEKKGFLVYGSKANYLFFKVPMNCNFGAYMEQFGILVRSCGNYPGLGNQFYRIAVKSEEENKVFAKALELL